MSQRAQTAILLVLFVAVIGIVGLLFIGTPVPFTLGGPGTALP